FFITLLLPIATLFPYTTLFRSFNAPVPGPLYHKFSPEQEGFKVGPRCSHEYQLKVTGCREWSYHFFFFRKYFRETYIIRLGYVRSEEHTSELQSRENIVCRLLL